MGKHNDLGKHGEMFAVEYLVKLGYQILSTNYRVGHKEIDIIAQHEGVIIFVEVKTRTNLSFGNPESFVNEKKKNNIIVAAQHYLDLLDSALVPVRFDVISVLIQKNCDALLEIIHFKDAYY